MAGDDPGLMAITPSNWIVFAKFAENFIRMIRGFGRKKICIGGKIVMGDCGGMARESIIDSGPSDA